MTYAEFFYEIKNKFMGADLSDISEHLAFQFNIEDEKAGGIFYVEVKDGVLAVEPYEYYDRDAMFTATPDTFLKIAEGKIDPIWAFTVQKLKVEGNIDKALRLKDIIEIKQKQMKKEKKDKEKQEKLEKKGDKKIIDIGPDGGTSGGEVVFTGTPQEMIEHADTITAKYLRK